MVVAAGAVVVAATTAVVGDAGPAGTATVAPLHTSSDDPAAGPHAFGYTQPAIGAAPDAASRASAQPLPTLTVAAVSCGGGSVTGAAVAVYIGSCAGFAPPTLESAGGGYCEKDARAVAAIVPAPDPPVCQGW